MAGTPDDMQIIAKVLGGEVNAFEQLLVRYETPVARIVAAHVPDDHVAETAHETFIRAYKSLSGYAPKKPFINWLTTIALRSCHDFWRQQYRRKDAPACDMSEDGQLFLENAMSSRSKDEFDALASCQEARQILDLLLDQLSPMDRMILTLIYLEERSTRETAEMLDISVANVKVRAFRAKRKSQSFLKRHGIQGG